MRIFLVGINYSPDLIGVAKYNTELCESLVAAGHEVRVVTAPPYYPAWKIPADFHSAYFRLTEKNGVQLTRAPIYVPHRPSGPKRLLHHASFALSSIAPVLFRSAAWRPDVFIAVAPSLMSAAFVSFAARAFGAKSWLHLQDFEVEAAFELGLLQNRKLRAPMLAVERHILKSFDRVSTISPQMMQRLASKDVAMDRIREVRNWIDTKAISPSDRDTEFRRELGLTPSHLVGLYSGTMSSKQGLDLIIDAAAMLEQDHPDIQFILCGDGPQKPALMRMAADRKNIRFLELQPNNRFNELLATADFHLIPQKVEATDLVLPSKLGGILSSGRPAIVMASAGTALSDEVKDAGLVIAPGEVTELVEAICKIHDDPSLRAALGAKARNLAVTRWDRQAIINDWIKELTVLASPPLASEANEATELEGSSSP